VEVAVVADEGDEEEVDEEVAEARQVCHMGFEHILLYYYWVLIIFSYAICHIILLSFYCLI
jgi:hypothetical protein